MTEDMSNNDDIRDYILFKAEESKKSLLMKDNYDILQDTVKQCKYLSWISPMLIDMIYNLDRIFQSWDENIYKPSIDYDRYKYYSLYVNQTLNALYCIMTRQDVGIYIHRHAGMKQLSKIYYPEHIIDRMDLKDGRSDYLTSIDAQGHEIKMIEGIRICFTRSQIINLNENDYIWIFKRIRDSFYQELTNVGCKYVGTMKFSNILNKKCPYTIDIRDSSGIYYDIDDMIIERQRILTDRRKQMTIDDAWR